MTPSNNETDPLASYGNTPDDTAMIHDMQVDAFLAECLNVETEVLAEHMRRLPGHTAYWNAQAAEAGRKFEQATRERHELRARLRQHLRATMAKATVDGVADALETNEEYVAAQEKCIALEAEMLKAQGFAKAVDAKRSMLQALGGLVRAEFGPGGGGSFSR